MHSARLPIPYDCGALQPSLWRGRELSAIERDDGHRAVHRPVRAPVGDRPAPAGRVAGRGRPAGGRGLRRGPRLTAAPWSRAGAWSTWTCPARRFPGRLPPALNGLDETSDDRPPAVAVPFLAHPSPRIRPGRVDSVLLAGLTRQLRFCQFILFFNRFWYFKTPCFILNEYSLSLSCFDIFDDFI